LIAAADFVGGRERVRIFKTKWFNRFDRKERIEDSALAEAVQRAEEGLVDADLGGYLIKQRVARAGRGRSGGYRTLIVFKSRSRAVFMFGFAKSSQDNLPADEENGYKLSAAQYLALSEKKWTRWWPTER
jgi:hypothetical protein